MVVVVVLAGFGGGAHMTVAFGAVVSPVDLLSTELVVAIVVLGPHHRPQLLHIHPLPGGSGSAQQGGDK